VNYLWQIRAIFKDFALNLLKKGLESPGKVLKFHLLQRVDTLYVTVGRRYTRFTPPPFAAPPLKITLISINK
jgi:hypothetical protein